MTPPPFQPRVMQQLRASLVLVSLAGSLAGTPPDPRMCMQSGATLPFGKPTREAYFQFPEGFLNFNHGGFGGTPLPVRKHMEAVTDVMEASPTEFFSQGYHSIINGIRPRLAELLHANASDIVFLDDASAGLNAVLRSTPWQRGDVLLLTSAAYALLPNVARWLEERYGIQTMVAEVAFPCTGDEDFLRPVRQVLNKAAAAGLKVRLAVFDHVASYPPVVFPVRELAELVKLETNGEALVLVDGAHAVGQVPVDLTYLAAAGVDCYIGNGHKWLMAPHGSGVLWATPTVQAFLEPAIISSANAGGTAYQDRFDYIGTRDYTPWCSMGAALDFRKSKLGGEDCVQKYCVALGRWGAATLAERFGTEAASPANMTAAMAGVRLPIPLQWSQAKQDECATTIRAGLMSNTTSTRMQLVAVALPRKDNPDLKAWWIRVSAQVYLDAEDMLALAARIESLAKTCDTREAHHAADPAALMV